MAGQPVIGTITGIPSAPTVNVRAGPGTTFQTILQIPKNVTGLRVLDVQPDASGGNSNGKLYQWLRLVLPDGISQGWVRDDLLAIIGDASRLGYGLLTAPTIPFFLVRQAVQPVQQPVQPVQPVQAVPVQPVRPVQAVPVQPVVAVQPVQPVQPVVPVQTVVPVVPVQPVQAVPVQPVQAVPVQAVPVQPVVAVQPVQPVVPVQPVQPVKPVQPVQVTQVQAAPAPVQIQPAAGQAVIVQPAAPAQPAVAAPAGPPTAIGMVKTGSNVRSGPAATYPALGKFNYRESTTVTGFKPDEGNGWLNWIKIAYQGKEGWIREDFLRPSGLLSQAGLAEDLYPSPAQDSWWVRDYDPDGTKLNNKHAGWDQGGNKGAAITAGPRGGYVIKDALCKSCGPEGASSVEKGFTLMDSRVWNDPNWNFGYGHYVIVRYDHDKLPASTQKWLAANNMAGFHAFVMHAHLSAILVKAGDTVTAGQQIAKLGNSGNSEGPHLHLELRFGSDPNSQWPNIAKGLSSPKQLFFR